MLRARRMPKSVRSLWHRHTTRSAIAAGSVVAVLIIGGASAWAASTGSSADAGYRTATATVATVQQTLDSTGTLEPVHQADLAFQVNGQVTAVNVSVGQQVAAGQILATLDTTSLEAALTSAQSSVTAEEEQLSSDEASESSSSSTSSSGSTTSTGTPGGTGSTSNLSAQQATLVADQHKADADSMQAAGDVPQANAACGTSGSAGSGSGPDGGTSTAGASSSGPGGAGGAGSTSSGPGATSTGSGSGDATCTADLQAALADQQKVSQDQQTVARDETALAALIKASSPSTGAAAPNSSTKATAATPAQVAADQATLDADNATLSEAEGSLSQATLSSPLTGTVVSVGVAAGQSVSTGSSSAQIEIISPGAYEVSTTVSVLDVGQVTIGDAATITLDGTTTPLAGTVAQIGPPTSSSSTSYPMVISIPQALTGIHDGASVSVSTVVSEAKDVVAVPTSAVHHLSRTAYVTEIRNGEASNVAVQVGTVGDLLTQINSGVKAGDTVVLANMNTPLPSSNTTFPAFGGGLGGGGGRFPGGAGIVRVG